MGARRVFLWCFLASLSATAILGVAALLFDWRNQERIVGTAALLATYSLAALGCTTMIVRGRSVIASWTSLVGLGTSLTGWLVLIWLESEMSDLIAQLVAKWSFTATLLALAGLHVAVLGLVPLRRPLGRGARIGAWVFTIGALVAVTLIIWELFEADDSLMRLIGASLILGALGTIATPLLWRLERIDSRAGEDASLGRAVPVSITCPKCGVDQTLLANRPATCKSCRLRIRVDVEEPRCACGYLLFGLTGDVCPECGRAIPDELRWAGPDAAVETSA